MKKMRYFIEVTEDEAVLIQEEGGRVQLGASGHGNNPQFPGSIEDPWMLMYSKAYMDERDNEF